MLRRLTLIITHNCNLRCTYCYAKGGNYGLHTGTMSETMAIDIVDHFLEKFGSIKQIFFFGGEPLLALNVIKKVCNYFKKILDRGSINEMPVFAVITNGTLISDEFIELVLQYNICITVSLDGPPAIHNMHRKTIDKLNTSDIILKNIEKLSSHQLKFAIECTYTSNHWNNGYLPIDIYKYLTSLGPKIVTLVEELASPPDKGLLESISFKDYYSASIDLFNEAVRELYLENKLIYVGLIKILDALIKRPAYLNDQFCSGGIDTFAVNPSGQTYPCHMLNNQTKFHLGNYKQIDSPINILPSKRSFRTCTECPLKIVCRACPARMHFRSKTGLMQPDPKGCQMLMAFATIVNSTILKENRLYSNYYAMNSS